MKLHQRPHLIYKLDETGLKLTCSSVNQNILAAEGSRRVSSTTQREKGETVTVVACMESVETIGFPLWFCIRESKEGKNVETLLMQEVHLLLAHLHPLVLTVTKAIHPVILPSCSLKS
jgi:hypothetical protein